MKKILVFHHSDLDGMGVKILSILYAKYKEMEYETYKCNYHDIDETVRRVVTNTPDEDIEEIIIGDISVSKEEVVQLLQSKYESGIPVRLRDHHATAEWLNKFSWAKVTERIHNVNRCGTYQLSLDSDFTVLFQNPLIPIFISEVDNWDTWKWKSIEDPEASDLNALFQILGESDFTDYMLKLFESYDSSVFFPESLSASDLFTEFAKALIDAHNRSIRKNADKCESDMWITNLELPKKVKSYVTGIVFANHDISEVADIILSRHPEIDILMLIGFPRNISYRTQKTLDIPLGDVAKLITGSGGGHPMAAGSVISKSQFKNMMESCIYRLSNKKVTCNNLSVMEEYVK